MSDKGHREEDFSSMDELNYRTPKRNIRKSKEWYPDPIDKNETKRTKD